MKAYIRAMCVAMATLGAPGIAAADSYPTQPIKIIVPLSPGGTTDALSRAIAQDLSKSLGQPVIIENKPGANNIIGTRELAKAAPDGYTMGMLISTHAINPHIAKSLPYDSKKDFIPLALIAIMPGIMTVHPSVPVNNVQELIALAKAKPGTLAYGQPGGLSSGHLSMEYLKYLANVDILSVPYKGAGPALADLAAGHFQVLINSPTQTIPLVRDGRLKALATTGAKRPAALSSLPTLAESGFPGFETYEWYGLFFPAGVAPTIVEKMHGELMKIMASPAMAKRILDIGAESSTATPAEFAMFIDKESDQWGRLIKTLNIKPTDQ